MGMPAHTHSIHKIHDFVYVFQLNTDMSRSNWRLCPIGQHLVNLIVDKQFDTCLWCLIVNSTAIRA